MKSLLISKEVESTDHHTITTELNIQWDPINGLWARIDWTLEAGAECQSQSSYYPIPWDQRMELVKFLMQIPHPKGNQA